MSKKTIEIKFSRTVTYHRIIEVDNEAAEGLMTLDGSSGDIYRDEAINELVELAPDEEYFLDRSSWVDDIEVKEFKNDEQTTSN